ncbi:TPA: glutaredoxin-like protein NrdH [Streptococcus equi subsp. zooepidemicus]|nr:glutaredoxin-like protein NrdH [Streptococcus equi subsp. zooepidemicus]HEL1344678.1 glutaredoxin-like protein NrdH [Streptococcus equi subsp. zooepidemicus]
MSENTIDNITLYSKSNCVKCTQTKRLFEKYGIAYQEVNLEAHPELVEQFKAQGFMEAPVIVAPHKSWSGFRMDEIKTLARLQTHSQETQLTQKTPCLAQVEKESREASKKLSEKGGGTPPPSFESYRG